MKNRNHFFAKTEALNTIEKENRNTNSNSLLMLGLAVSISTVGSVAYPGKIANAATRRVNINVRGKAVSVKDSSKDITKYKDLSPNKSNNFLQKTDILQSVLPKIPPLVSTTKSLTKQDTKLVNVSEIKVTKYPTQESVGANYFTPNSSLIPQLPSLSVASNSKNEKVNTKIHTIRRGETVSSIARSYSVSYKDIISANNLRNPNLIHVNQKLVIPRGNYKSNYSKVGNSQRNTKFSSNIYMAKLREDVVKVKNKYQNSQSIDRPLSSESTSVVPQDYNEILKSKKDSTLALNLPPLPSIEEYLPENNSKFGYMWPAKGTLTSGYGWRWGRMHRGIDIAAPIGTPIIAAASGEVISAGWNSGGFGNLVKLKHKDGSVTLYAHNNRLLVRTGQKVIQGQQIAEMGSTGRSTGPHLHFEIRPNGINSINPIARLPR